MVKLETQGGGVAFVHPEQVWIIGDSDDGLGSVVHLNNGAVLKAKGTPDEVHAKLFPETAMSALSVLRSAEDAMADVSDVLEWLAHNAPSDVPLWAREAARKALGREGA